MTTRITDTGMASNLTAHTATAHPVPDVPDEPTLWSVTWLPGRALTHDQAVTAMTIAEMVVERAHVLADPASRLWWHMDGWAAELGMTAKEAVAGALLSPEDFTEDDEHPNARDDLRQDPGEAGGS